MEEPRILNMRDKLDTKVNTYFEDEFHHNLLLFVAMIIAGNEPDFKQHFL